MSDETPVPHEFKEETPSGLYRKLTPKMLHAVLTLMWAVGAGLCCLVWNDVRDVNKRVTTLEAQRTEDQRAYTELRESIKDIQRDIKELLREIRK